MPNKAPGFDSIRFDDPNFKLLILPERQSFLTEIGMAAKVFHEEIEIKYFYEGSSTLLIGNTPLTAEAGDIVVINPYEYHATIRFGENVGKYHLYTVSLDFLNEGGGLGIDLRDLIIGGYVRFRNLIRGDARMADILIRAADETALDAPYRKVITRALMTEFFGLMLRSYTEEATEDAGSIRHYKTVEPAIRRIRDGYAEALTSDELVSLCRITKSHFCRVFKKATGMTATDYLMRYRLRIADIMLKGTSSDIAEISAECGFQDENYFCRCYKKVYGFSPGKKRKL